MRLAIEVEIAAERLDRITALDIRLQKIHLRRIDGMQPRQKFAELPRQLAARRGEIGIVQDTLGQ